MTSLAIAFLLIESQTIGNVRGIEWLLRLWLLSLRTHSDKC